MRPMDGAVGGGAVKEVLEEKMKKRGGEEAMEMVLGAGKRRACSVGRAVFPFPSWFFVVCRDPFVLASGANSSSC